MLLLVASKVVMMKQCSGKIVVKSKNSLYKLIIPYQASVLHGLVLVFNIIFTVYSVTAAAIVVIVI